MNPMVIGATTDFYEHDCNYFRGSSSTPLKPHFLSAGQYGNMFVDIGNMGKDTVRRPSSSFSSAIVESCSNTVPYTTFKLCFLES